LKSARTEVEADKFLIVAHAVDAMRPLSREEWASMRVDDLQERKLQVVCRKADQMQAPVTADTLHLSPEPLEKKYDDLLLYATDLEARLCVCRGQRDALLKEVARKRGLSLPMIFIFGLIAFLAARLSPALSLDLGALIPEVPRTRGDDVVSQGEPASADQRADPPANAPQPPRSAKIPGTESPAKKKKKKKSEL
jgi:hypothetical protein